MKNSNKMINRKVNNLSELNNNNIFNSVDNIEYFYKGFLGKLDRKPNEINGLIFEADSRFGDGKIFISWAGAWYDEATGEMGSMADFISKIFPSMTPLGAIHTVFAEYFEFRDYHHKIEDEIDLKDELDIVRDIARAHKRVKNECVNDFRVDTIDICENGHVHYTELHEVLYREQPDLPVIQNSSYTLDISCAPDFISYIYGVQKIVEHPNTECIYFVENPLQQAILSEHVDAPVYIRPDQESFFHYDYNRLVKSKEVLLAKKVMPGPFEIEKLEYRTFDSDEDVDFFTFYDEEMPRKQDWEKNESYMFIRDELLTQKFMMAKYLQNRGIEVICRS